MSEKTKDTESTGPKFRENGIMEKKWLDGNILQFTYLDHSVLRFDRRVAASGNRDNAERMGWQGRLGDLGAIEVKDFPDRMARSMEAKRLIKRGIDHYQGPSSDWNIPAERAPAYVPTLHDVSEVLHIIQPAHAETLLKLTMAEVAGDAKAGLAKWTATKEGAAAWATIQANRRTQTADSADDIMAAMLAAAAAAGA
jgi:hypothetical protein